MDPITMALLFGGGSALLGGAQAAQKNKMDKANMMANAESIKYSPWTHMDAKMQGAQTEDPALAGLKAGLGGAMTGATFGQQFAKGGQTAVGEQGPLLKFK